MTIDTKKANLSTPTICRCPRCKEQHEMNLHNFIPAWFFGLMVNLSFYVFFIFTPIFILINVLYLKAIEEKEMEKKFGKQYLEYKRKVSMFFPNFKRHAISKIQPRR